MLQHARVRLIIGALIEAPGLLLTLFAVLRYPGAFAAGSDPYLNTVTLICAVFGPLLLIVGLTLVVTGALALSRESDS